jgi:molybdate transport system substrate-binding protein
MACSIGAFQRVVYGFLLAAACSCAAAEHVAVAAAANLVYVLEPLNVEFAMGNPGVDVRSEIGASGSLVAQISNGAPYDVFLSADMEYPKKLVQAGGAEASSLVTFAVGKLALWTMRPGLDVSSVESVVRNPAVVKLAIANPSLAPYGRAAEGVLAKLGLTDVAKSKLVFGENITQTAQYVSSGNADAGFVALSLILSPNLKDKGRWLEISPGLYDPIAQGGVLTTRGAANPAARRYLAFLTTPAARKVFAQFGYGPP